MNDDYVQALNKMYLLDAICKKLSKATMEQLVQIGKILKL